MANFYTMSGQSFTLGSSISSTQTTILLTSFKVPVSGTSITMATMNTSIAYGTIAPGTSQAELISFTGVSQNVDGTATLTGVTRGLNKEYPYTESSSFKQPHAGQSIFILSDAPQVFNEYPAKRNSETIVGKFTFPQSGSASAAVAGTVYAAPTNDIEFATKKYVDDTASFGAPLATTGVAGIVELPTQTQVEAGTQVGGTGAQLALPNVAYGARKIIGYGITTGSANSYALAVTPTPTAYATGQIVGFQASFTNTGNSTININGLGAKNLFLGSTGLFAGAISTSSYVGAVYDGTQFEIVEGSDLISASATANTLALRRSTGDVTVPSTPTASTDATSKTYVDSIGTGFVDASAVNSSAVTSTTNETTVATIAIVGGVLSTNKFIRVRTNFQTSWTSDGSAVTYRIKYGGTTLISATFDPTGTPTETMNLMIDSIIQGAGTTSSQEAQGFYIQSGEASGASAIGGVIATATSAIDSTVSQNLLVTVQNGSSNSTVSTVLTNYTVQKVT